MHADRIDAASFLLSVAFHILIMLVLIAGFAQKSPKRVALITDVTLIDLAGGQGAAGEEENTIGLEQKQPERADAVKIKAEPKPKPEAKPASKPAQAPAVEQADVEKIIKELREKRSRLDMGISRETLRGEARASEEGVLDSSDDYVEEGGELVAGSAPVISGSISARKYKRVEWLFPKQLPEETELVIEITVMASGIIKDVRLARTSGYPELDRAALAQARKLEFEPLPREALQEENTGALLFKFGALK